MIPLRPLRSVDSVRCFFRASTVATALLAFLVPPAAGSSPNGVPRRAVPARAADFDYGQKIDVNQVSMVVTNTGSIAWDKLTGNPGFEFPKGSGKHALYAAGPWFGATVGGSVRVTVSEYSDEYGPGGAPFGVPENPNDPALRVYKLERSYANSATRDSALAEYALHAEPRGARHVAVLQDGTLDIQGDQMTWAVYNDLDPALHTNRAGRTPPLGLEVRQTTFAFDRGDPLGRTVFIAYHVINQSGNLLEDFRFGMWSDPDLGDAVDDLVGCDTLRNLGYCYNAGTDAIYGTNPPAVGFDLLLASIGFNLPATAFVKYINGTDPQSALESYHYLHGRDAAGNTIINPTNGQPTTFMHTGDPVSATGWLDSNPSDRRMALCAGPFFFAAGDSMDLVVAIVVSQGSDRLDSVARLYADDDFVQAAFDSGPPPPPPPPPPCAVVVGFDFSPNTLNLRSMGRWVSGRIEPPPPLSPADIDVASIRLAGSVPVDPAGPVSIGDGNGNGAPDLTVKFDRSAVQAALAAGDSVPVTVGGEIGETCFVGGDVARMIHAPVTAPAAGAVITPGLAAPIRWETPPQVTPLWVAVLASMDGGEAWSLVAKHLPNTGVYQWHPPYATSANARVAVVLVEREISEDVVEGVLGIGPRFSLGGATDVGPDAPSFALGGVLPHPARGSFRVSFRLPDAGAATLSLYDLAGRKVWAREVGALGAGSHTVAAGEGASLPAGVYLIRLVRPGQERSARAVLMP